jgi:hypothetical protein
MAESSCKELSASEVSTLGDRLLKVGHFHVAVMHLAVLLHRAGKRSVSREDPKVWMVEAEVATAARAILAGYETTVEHNTTFTFCCESVGLSSIACCLFPPVCYEDTI